MASMAWVFLQSRRPVMSMIIIIMIIIKIISPYSSDKNTYQMLHRIVKKQVQRTVVSIPSKEKNAIVKSNICTTRLYLKLIYKKAI